MQPSTNLCHARDEVTIWSTDTRRKYTSMASRRVVMKLSDMFRINGFGGKAAVKSGTSFTKLLCISASSEKRKVMGCIVSGLPG